MLQHDQSLVDLADLPEGWKAIRETVGGAWKRKKKGR
jgi:hypothetical protein